MIFSLLRKTALPFMVIIFKIHGTWINKRYITASRCPLYRWSIFAARSTRLTAWNASCLLPLLLNVKQHLFLSAKSQTCEHNPIIKRIASIPAEFIKSGPLLLMTTLPSAHIYLSDTSIYCFRLYSECVQFQSIFESFSI